MNTSEPTRIPARARLAAGLTLASYVLSNPTRCWTWLRDPFVSHPLRLLEYTLTLLLLGSFAGILRGMTIGVYLPVYGTWRIPLLDAVSYYLVVVIWGVFLVFLGSHLLRLSARLFGSAVGTPDLWYGLVAFSLTPLFLSLLFVVFPFESVRRLLSLSALFGVLLFWNGTSQMRLVPPHHQLKFCLVGLTLLTVVGYYSLLAFMGLLVPSYPVRLLSEPPLSRDALGFKHSVEMLQFRG